MDRRNWQRSELILALNLYFRMSFGQYHNRNPEILRLAEALGRSANAVAMKLSNFASFDPYHQARGIKGLQNAGQADREIWDEFSTDWEELAAASEVADQQLLRNDNLPIQSSLPELTSELAIFSEITSAEQLVKIRLGQQFFRKVTLVNYGSRCCICGIPIPELLVASHIVPWRDDETLRVNPHNGLCLCMLHDKAFDRGLITIRDDYAIIVGKAIKQYLPHSTLSREFTDFDGRMINMPDKFLPKQEYIAVHRERYFLG